MVLELHVWGPAFGLPSIDAHCLATIAYLQLVVPREEWVLVASSDTSISPTGELPALKNGNSVISRFTNIIEYLRQHSNGAWDLNKGLSELQSADVTAFSSLIPFRGQPLIDLSLYVSSQNYNTNTLSAYSTILQFPTSWIAPPKLRSAARARTRHLGLSSLDVDAAATEEEEDRNRNDDGRGQTQREKMTNEAAASQIPKSLLTKPAETVTSLLGRSTHRAQFKLESLCLQLADPLQELLITKGEGKKGRKYLVQDDAPTSLDCLALGYLSLALAQGLEFPWLRISLETNAPELSNWAREFSRRIYGEDVTVAEALSPSQSQSHLPWHQPSRPALTTLGASIYNSLADATPILADLRGNRRIQADIARAHESEEDGPESRHEKVTMRKEYLASIGTVIAGLGAMGGYMAWAGLGPFQQDEEEESDRLGGVWDQVPPGFEPEANPAQNMFAAAGL